MIKKIEKRQQVLCDDYSISCDNCSILCDDCSIFSNVAFETINFTFLCHSFHYYCNFLLQGQFVVLFLYIGILTVRMRMDHTLTVLR